MPLYLHALIGLAYVTAAVVAGLAVNMLAGPDAGTVAPWAFGLALAVGFALIHQAIVVGSLVGAVARLRGGNEIAGQDADALRRQVAEALAEMEASRALHAERVTELKELRGLVGQLADRIEKSHGRGRAARRGAASSPAGAPRPRAAGRPRSAADLARAPLVAVPPQAPVPEIALPQALPADMSAEDTALLETVREALERRRIDLFLQPVMRLPQRRPEFHEAFTRLRAKDGSQIKPESYLDIATRAGMVAAIDNVLLFRCVEQVRRNLDQDLTPRYFCNIATATLSDGGIFADFVEYLEANPQLADSLIFEISQRQSDALDASQRTALDRLTAAGHRLSMDGVTDLELDANRLANLGFGFVKLEAGALMPKLGDDPVIDLEGLGVALKQNGIALVVEKIETEEMLLELLEYGIDYGQGFLFGGPRRVR